MRDRKNKIIVCLCLFVFMLSISSLFTLNLSSNNDLDVKTSTDNYLFNGKEYIFDLDDVYDDENTTKIYTGANFQSVFLENDTIILNETVSPVNNTNYKSPDLGDYPATYSFENDVVGSIPTDWTESGTGELEVFSDVEGHDKVMNFKFPNPSDYGQVDITSQTGELTIEFWVYRPDLVGQCYFRMMGTSSGSEDIYFNGGGGVTYYKADSSFPNIFTMVAETWYRIKIELDVDASNNIISVWVDGVLKIDEEETHNDTPDIGHIRLYRGNAGSTLGINWDAFGFSWDPAYTPFEHHAGTYSFTNYADGTEGYDITGFADYYSAGANCSGTIISEFGDHKKLLELDDRSAVGSVGIRNNFDYTEVDSTIEFWLLANISNVGYRGLYIYFYDQDYVTTMVLLLSGTAFRYYNGTSDYTLSTYTANEFFHVKMVLDDTADTYDVYVDDVLKETDINYISPSTSNAYRIYFATRTGNTGYKINVDAIGYSADPYYTIGDNLLPSLGNTMPVGLNMINGTYDYTDNMEINDGSFTNFTSTPFSGVSQYIDSVSFSAGEPYLGNLANTQIDDSSYYSFGSGGTTLMNIFIDPVYAGRDFYLDINSYANDGVGPETHYFRVNGGNVLSGSTIHQHGFLIENVNTLQIYVGDGTGWTLCTLYYFMLVDVASIVNAELNYTLDLDFSEVDTSKLLALDVSSYHYTNISTDIIGKIYNYDSSSYTQMFSSSNMAETENYFMNDTIPTDYLNPSGNLRLYFTGSNSFGTFKQIIDYIRIRFYYKMDLTHTISFETNGLWKYRWELIGSLHYTSWTYFEVVDPVPNFNTISQSEVLSRWILQGADISPIEDFHDDINTNAWDLYGVDRTMSVELNPTEDSATLSDYPTTNVGQSPDYSLMETTQTRYIFFKSGSEDIPYFTNNISTTTNGTLNLYQIDPVYHDAMVYLYQTSSFDEDIITWNNQPAPIGDYLTITDDTSTYNTWASINLGNTIQEYYFINVQVYGQMKSYRSSEASSNKPKMTYYLYKNYFGEGYMYMQTGSTELIGLESPDYGTHKTLSSGDYFEVDFETSSDSQIDLILLNNSVVQKTLTLSQSGNTNFNRHTAQISVSEDLEFDQLKISSTFEDQDNIKVYDIKTYKYTVTGDYKDFYVSPNNQKEVYLTPDTYNLRIFEEGDKKVDVNLTIPVPDDYYIYTPLPNRQCRLGLFSPDNIYLPLTDYHIDVNRSLNGEYNQFALLGDVFNVDMGTYIYIDIYDRFNTLIDSFTRLASDYIDLELEVYQLRIKSLLEDKTTVNINGTNTYEVLPYDYIEFMLATSYYLIGYYDDDNDYREFTVYLNSNQAYSLNKSELCFLSYADQQGNHLSFDNYKTYINGSLIYEQIFYEDAGDDVNITITDRYDFQVYSGIYSVVSGDNFIPITLTMYSLKVMNQQEVFNHINITRDPNDSEYFWSEWIAPGERIEFKLFAGDYIINLTDTENGWSSYGYELNGDDTLLFTSDNIISNVLINIANTNTTIGNLITYVQIDLTNQNTEINNSIISIVINIESINSTLGDLLIDIQTEITNIESSIISEIVDMGVQITNVNSSLSEQILTITTDISNLDSSITSQFLTLGVSIENINGSIIDQILLIGVNITNVQTYLNDQILNIGVNISNLDTSITNQITSVISSIENVNTTILAQISSLSSDIINVNSSIIGQMVELGVNITNVQTVITDQILSLEVDISNYNSSIVDQILLVIADIENIETVIDDQTLVILSDITNVNSTLLNQMVVLGVNITNINATITDQILMLNVDLTNINASISNLLYYMDVDITSIGNNITSFYAFTNTSFINLNNVMNTSFIYMENNIISINQTISNLVIGISNDIYLINGTISTMITTLENNLFLMNVSIDTALFNLDTTIDIIGANITSNYILLNNTLNIMDTNIDDSRIAMINNLLLVNNTISTLISGVYSSVYLINNSIYTAVIDLGTYLSLMNNTINGDLSFILSQNEFLTEIYQMTMFSELLNWTDIGLNTSLLTSQIDVWTFINDYVNQSIDIHLKYDDIIDNLTISAQNTIDQYLPATDVEYRLWSEELQEYITEWEVLPDNKTVSFGFFEEEIPEIPDFNAPNTVLMIILIVIACIFPIAIIGYLANRYRKKSELYRKSYADKITLEAETISKFSQGRRIK